MQTGELKIQFLCVLFFLVKFYSKNIPFSLNSNSFFIFSRANDEFRDQFIKKTFHLDKWNIHSFYSLANFQAYLHNEVRDISLRMDDLLDRCGLQAESDILHLIRLKLMNSFYPISYLSKAIFYVNVV